MSVDRATSHSWLLDLLWLDVEAMGWWESDQCHERFIAVPNADSPRQLLPWRPSSVIASAGRVSDDRSRTTGWRDSAAVAALLAEATWSPRRRIAVRSTGSLIGLVSSVLDIQGASGIVISGPPRANQKPVVQLLDRAGRTVAYVKVAWNELTRRLLAHERGALQRLGARQDIGFTVPSILASGEFGSVTWLATGPATVTTRHRPTVSSVDRLATAIERTAPVWRGPTHEAAFVAKLRDRSASLAIARSAVEALAERESDRSISLAASHGDFVPWNMISGDPRAAVWDWERYGEAEPAGTDRLHFRLQTAMHRRNIEMSRALQTISAELDSVIPDVATPRRQSHLDWYVASLLCRYESDSREQRTTQLLGPIEGLAGFLRQRGVTE